MIVWILLGIIVGSTAWNIYRASAAKAGVEFDLAATPDAVNRAIQASLLGRNTKARLSNFVRGVEIRPGPGGQYVYGTKYGDEGVITISPAGGNTRVRAATKHLFVGWNRNPNARSGFYQLVFALTSIFMKLLYRRPNASRMQRFQSGLQRRLEKALVRTANP